MTDIAVLVAFVRAAEARARMRPTAADVPALKALQHQTVQATGEIRRRKISKDFTMDGQEITRRVERSLGQALILARDPQQRQRDHAEQVGIKRATYSWYTTLGGVDDEKFESMLKRGRQRQSLSYHTLLAMLPKRFTKEARGVKAEPEPEPKPETAPGRPELLRNTHHHNVARIVGETVSTLEGLCLGVKLTQGRLDEINQDDRARWVSSLRGSLRVLNALTKELG